MPIDKELFVNIETRGQTLSFRVPHTTPAAEPDAIGEPPDMRDFFNRMLGQPYVDPKWSARPANGKRDEPA